MKVDDIEFLKIKKIGENILALAHYKNKPIILNINNLEINKKVYKEKEKFYIEIKKEDLLKILFIIENYICKYVYELHPTTKDYKKFKNEHMNSVYKEDYIKLEVHTNCLLLEEDQLENKKVIEVNELIENNFIDIKIHFIGIKFFEKNFEPVFIVRKIIKHIEEDDVSIFSIESENEDSEDDILYNDDKITTLINQDFPKTQIEI